MLENLVYAALSLLLKGLFRSWYFSRQVLELSADECEESYKKLRIQT